MKPPLLVITGGSRGIGRATARKFTRNNYDVLNLSRNPCTVKDVVNIATDLTDKNWLTTTQPMLQQHCENRPLICLTHNAGILHKDSSASLPARQLRTVLEIHVVAAAILNQVVLPFMQPASSIVYISSTLGHKAVANTASYVISKHAVIGQMRATCQDLAGSGIITSCICPGFTDTEMLREHVGNDENVMHALAQKSTQNRLARSEEIADTIWFASQTEVINGAVIDAHLGQIEN